MSYFTYKSLHMLSLVLLFGTGLGSAFYKFMTDLSGDVRAIYTTNRLVVLADWLFTTPTVLLQPISGYFMLQQLPYAWHTPWLLSSIVLYLLAGICWLPVVWLQIRMRDLSKQAVEFAQPLPEPYSRYAKYWFWLGVPAFIAMILIVLLMVFKPALWS